MIYIQRAAVVAALAVIAASPAMAADLTVAPVETPVAQSYIWTGPYIGANLGWANVKSDWHDVDFDWDGGTYDAGSDGFTIGGQIGYNYQLQNNVVLGVEADLNYATNSTSFDAPGDGDVTLENDMNGFGSIRARLGYALDNVLPYVTGGLAVANFKHQWIEHDDVSDSWPDFGGWEAGWVAGGGVEWGFAQNWTVKFEGLYAGFGNVTSTNDDGYRMDVDRDVGIIRAGLNYRF